MYDAMLTFYCFFSVLTIIDLYTFTRALKAKILHISGESYPMCLSTVFLDVYVWLMVCSLPLENGS